MKQKLFYTLGLIVLGMAVFGAKPANAQTTAVGPYYANPSWDQQLPSSTRFIVLSNWSSAAVLDRETGLVWEKSPDTNTRTWLTAHAFCNNKSVGGRRGWRLPTLQELASLVDPGVGFPGPTLPSGHPFINVQSSNYWSATTNGSNTSIAWGVFFNNGNVSFVFKTDVNFVWCVRGGQGVDPQ